MPRNKSGIIKRPIMNIENINAAIFDIENGMTIETAAKKHMIAKTTLWRHYKKRKQVLEAANSKATKVNKDNNAAVFTNEEEIFLAEYIKTLAQHKYNLNRNDVMKFAYIIAYKNQKKIPTQWSLKAAADEEWLDSFLNRHPCLPLDNSQTTIQTAKECLSLLLFHQIYNYLNTKGNENGQ